MCAVIYLVKLNLFTTLNLTFLQIVALTSEGKFESKVTKKRTAKDECKYL